MHQLPAQDESVEDGEAAKVVRVGLVPEAPGLENKKRQEVAGDADDGYNGRSHQKQPPAPRDRADVIVVT